MVARMIKEETNDVIIRKQQLEQDESKNCSKRVLPTDSSNDLNRCIATLKGVNFLQVVA